MVVQFKSDARGVRDVYKTSNDEHRFTQEELDEILSYKDISKEFEYNDWYGSSTTIRATLKSVEKDKWNDLIYTIEINRSIPKHYAPTPSDILRNRGLLFPTSVSPI
jgi:hypothetical protein